MGYRPNSALLPAIIALALAVLACNAVVQGPATPTTAARPTATRAAQPTGAPATSAAEETASTAPATSTTAAEAGLDVRDVSGYVDAYNDFHVVGEVFNHTQEPVYAVRLTVRVADGAGKTVIKDTDDNPTETATSDMLLITLAPGESSPFDYYVNVEDGSKPEEWIYSAEIAEWLPTEIHRATVVVEHSQYTTNEYGDIYLTGELVNHGDQPALVNSLAGAVLNEAGAVAAAEASFTLRHYLAAAGDADGNDRGPFVIHVYGPVPATQPAFYVDAEVTDALPAAGELGATVASHYVDSFGRLHVVAMASNNGTELLNVVAVAGVYAQDGTVLDAESRSSPIYVAPGESVPVAFDFFSNVNGNPAELARADHFGAQIDPDSTYATTLAVEALQTSNEDGQITDDNYYAVKGDVTNTSGSELTSATVIVSIFDANGALVASSYTSVYPTAEFIKPGDALPFDLTIALPKSDNPPQYTFTTTVQGYVK